MTERWKPVLGYEGRYEVSDQGRVKSLLTNKILSPWVRPDSGKAQVTLHGEVLKQQVRLVHILVLEAFIGPRPPGLEGLHRNDIGNDNTLTNLRWGTRSENMLDRVANGKHHFTQRDRCGKGHKYTPENTSTYPNGSGRRCRQCMREQSMRRREQQRAVL